jgi:hypothetical protein
MFLFFISCNKYERFNEKEINKRRADITKLSQSIIGEDEYNSIYAQMNDTVHLWIKDKHPLYEYYDGRRELLVDSVFCMNKTGSKIITAILRRCLDDCVQDNIIYLYGVKIDGQWYFFGGHSLTLPREFYQKDIQTPLSFEKLKQIATDRVYRGYLIKDKNGEWKVNENFFSRFYERDAYNYPFTTQEAWEESWLRLNRAKWKKRDATELE